MENYRCAVQSNDNDDGDASAVGGCLAQDDARSRDQEGDGGDAGQDECPEPASRYVRDADQLVGRSSPAVQEESSSQKTTAKIEQVAKLMNW